MANFFKRASQKEPNKLRWRIIHETLMVGSYDAERNNDGDHTRSVKRRKVAAFDFVRMLCNVKGRHLLIIDQDSTLIKTSSGNTFGRSAEDWQWWHSVVPVKLRELYSKG